MVHEYIGSKITIISRNDKRYEGVLHSIDVEKSTITLKDVRYFENSQGGTSGPASSTVFEMIVFRGSDITDLAVCQPSTGSSNKAGLPDSPAVVSLNEGSSPEPSPPDAGYPNQPRSGGGPRASKGSPKMSYLGASGGNPPSSRGGQKDSSKNRQRGGGGHSGRSFRGGAHSHHGGGSHQRSYVVGELKPRINQALKAELETDFDFSEHNKKFDKALGDRVGAASPDQPVRPGESASELRPGSASGSPGSGPDGAGGQDEAGGASAEAPDASRKGLAVGGYNKVSGFFDSISCETLDPERSRRSQGSSDPQAKAQRERQKMIDRETFGTSAVRSRGNSYNRGPHRRGGGGHRGGGFHAGGRFNRREA
ncbi:Scd6-like Sm domain protein [Cryptosporidium felis]|nr:Scd6-like Sm domain protein [Cryptosporidium felis]